MARYTGPRLRKIRQLGVPLVGLSRKSAQKRPYPPGQGAQNRRVRFSEYRKRLLEKQKIRFNYGLGERQLRRLMIEAKNAREPTGLVLLRLVEQRLDNVVFRVGLAPTIPAARQLVRHGHVLVNGKGVNIPSYRFQIGQELSVHPRSCKMEAILTSVAQPTLRLPPFLSFEPANFQGRMESLPGRDDIPIQVDEQLVVEYYSQRM